MFFKSLFSADEDLGGRYPKSRIEEAIERVVKGTDSRLRLLPGYRKRLLAPVVGALDHAVALVDDLPPPLTVSRESYLEERQLAALFASPETMLEDLGRDLTFRGFLAGHRFHVGELTALLRAEMSERQVLGRDIVDGQMRRDVPQTLVNFVGHRLSDLAAGEEETRCLLKQRTFDHLVTLALGRLASAETERADLTRQRDLLRRKLSALEHGDLSFDSPDAPPNREALSRDLDRITEQLHALGTDERVLEIHLEMVCEVLTDARRQLWSRDISLHLDAMNIERHPRDPSGRRIILRELNDAQGHRSILLLLRFDPVELPPPEDFLTAADRYFRATR
ncbi:hypothetical protein [Imhoffiella purpurea]|uniref:Uncharacterized protein n=1 Tax=Imhoffiella purpurea TaxID=1249627 RepID=W9V1G9_9GAMM|nr:hypothetical protein [Imhoffiella purpurea]EXJ13179.1 hypothetical protein D779_4003 [Imhoffiella purpurea]